MQIQNRRAYLVQDGKQARQGVLAVLSVDARETRSVRASSTLFRRSTGANMDRRLALKSRIGKTF